MNPNDPNVVMMELVAERLGAGLPGDAASQHACPILKTNCACWQN